MKHTALLIPLLAIAWTGIAAEARESKEFDADVNYDPAKIPHYDLPPLLITAEGKQVTTAEQWRTVRRPQILSLFSNLVYGRIPEPASPIQTDYEVLNENHEFMGGRATRKDIRIRFSNERGQAEMTILVFVPNGADQPVPAFMKHSFNDTQSNDFNLHPTKPDCIRCGWPLGEFFDRGYAFVAVYQQDLVGHNEVSFDKGIHRLFYQSGQSFPKSAYYASEVYRLLGKTGLSSEQSPRAGEPIVKSDVGFHIREGGHAVELYDWHRFLDFADYHLQR